MASRTRMRGFRSLENYASAIDAIYSALEDPASWRPAIDAIGRAIGGSRGLLQFVDGPRWKGAVACSEMSIDFEQGLLEWANSQSNPFRMTHQESPAVHLPLARDQIVSDAAFLESPIYAEFLRQDGVFHGIGVITSLGAAGEVLLTVNRAEEEAPFEAGELAALSRLSRHFARAFSLGGTIIDARRSVQAADALCETAHLACAIVATNGVVSHASPRAMALLSDHKGVRIARDSLHWSHPRDARRFAELHSSPDGGEMALRQGRTSLFVWVVPLRASLDDVVEGHRDSLVLFVDPSASPELHAEELEIRLGLTPTEADLACALLEHNTLMQAATALGISHNTAKMHQRSIYAKLDVRSRGELVRLLLQVSLRAPGRADST